MAIYIPELNLSPLKSATHKECVTDVLKEAEKCAAIAERLSKELAAFKKAVEYEVECFNERFKSALTEPLSVLDTQRDEALVATRAANRAALGYPDEEVQEAAKLIKSMTRIDMISTKAQYDEETGELTDASRASYFLSKNRLESGKWAVYCKNKGRDVGRVAKFH